LDRIEIDFRFVELQYELWALDAYRETLEEQIEVLRRNKKADVLAQLEKDGLTPDDPEYHSEYEMVYTLVDEIVPRFYRGPYLVALYGIFESAIEEMAGYIATQKGIALRLRDISGRTARERWSKYYSHVLDYEIGINESTWTKIEELRELRNAISHCNGRLSLLNPNLADKIRGWVAEKRGITTDYEFLLLSKEYLESAAVLVVSTIETMVERVKGDTSLEVGKS